MKRDEFLPPSFELQKRAADEFRRGHRGERIAFWIVLVFCVLLIVTGVMLAASSGHWVILR